MMQLFKAYFTQVCSALTALCDEMEHDVHTA